jgi:hypothetical protein
MQPITNPIIINYYNYLCSQWGVTPNTKIVTGYENVEARLRQLSKELWTSADVAGKAAIQQEVFDIYRGINILPINYYNLEGCVDQIFELADKKKKIENKTLAVGNNEGLKLGRFWFENMQDAFTRKDKEVSLRGRFNNDNKLKRAINLCYVHRDESEHAVLPHNIRRALELVSGGSIQNFKPMNARAVWEYICPVMMGGNVLDFSSGYGGRMMGAMSSKMKYHYTGIDPNTKTFQGLQALGELMTECRQGAGYEMHNIPSEDFDPEPGKYDAAFSSPPYFNLETYSDEPTQCMNRCTNLDAWFDLYAEPTVKMLNKALADDAIYAVNIADYKSGNEQFQIVDRWIDMSKKLGFRYVETVNMTLNVRPGAGNNKLQNGYKSEGIYIFKKTSSLTT